MPAEYSAEASAVYAYRFPAWAPALFLVLLAVLYLTFEQAIDFMVGQWNMEEFSHGYLIPFICAFLVWQRRHVLRCLEFEGTWYGLVVVVFGLGLNLAGRLVALYTVQHIALLMVVGGLALALAGWRALRVLVAPLGVLIFMIPLPQMFISPLSSALQLISSSLGVWLIRLAGVSVFLEGNVIDLGSYKLEVAQACSGLRYLLPLMTLAFLVACFYQAALWKRAVIFISSVPVTLLMNSLRIAIIGVMVDRWGAGMAEGMLHQIQGWMMFMLSTGVLLLEVVLLTRLGKERRPWREVLSLEVPAALPTNLPLRSRVVATPLLASGVVLMLFGAATLVVPSQLQSPPARETFATFPLNMGEWSGKRETMDAVYLDALKLDDYLLADYVGAGDRAVNLYVAWYDMQRTGDSTHSPKACLPGGGWRIDGMGQTAVGQLTVGAQTLRVNRAVIQYQDQRQLVYYWFQQRGRVITNEYLVKWYLLVDAVLRHRSDGALIRLIVPISASMSVSDADRELQGFLAEMVPQLTRYVPG